MRFSDQFMAYRKVAPPPPLGNPTWESGFRSGYAAGWEACAQAVAGHRAVILEFIRRHPGKRGVDITKATGIKACSVRTALNRLETAGEIAQSEKGKAWFIAEGEDAC